MTHARNSWNNCRIVPIAARILAEGRDGLLMTDKELMRRTGWGMKHLRRVYQAGNWRNVTVGDMDVFLGACGLYPANQRRYMFRLRRALSKGMDGIKRMSHLRATVLWRANLVNRLLKTATKVLESELEQYPP